MLNFLKEESECRLSLSVALYLNVVGTVSCRCPPGMQFPQDIVLHHPDRLQQVILEDNRHLHSLFTILASLSGKSKHQPMIVNKNAYFLLSLNDRKVHKSGTILPIVS